MSGVRVPPPLPTQALEIIDGFEGFLVGKGGNPCATRVGVMSKEQQEALPKVTAALAKPGDMENHVAGPA